MQLQFLNRNYDEYTNVNHKWNPEYRTKAQFEGQNESVVQRLNSQCCYIMY